MIFISILFWILSLYILYIVIQSAIDNSEMTKNLREIKDLLNQQIDGEPHKKEMERKTEFQYTIEEYEECPACGGRVLPNEEECPSCGLAIIDEN